MPVLSWLTAPSHRHPATCLTCLSHCANIQHGRSLRARSLRTRREQHRSTTPTATTENRRSPTLPHPDLPRARDLIAHAHRVVALTGAGISAESGVPTFRDAGGLWRNYRPEELATIGAFERDPRTVWEWYEWRRGFLATCEPNEGHRALARFFLRRGEDGIVTQNVDGLHTRAAIEEAGDGPPGAALPIEIHGAIARDRCNDCGLRAEAEPLGVRNVAARGTGAGEPPRDDTGADEPPPTDTLPRCAECGGLRRPDVVLFGEMLDSALLERAQTMAARADLCLVIGTSAVVYPAAGIPLATLHGGGRIIEVNPQATDLTGAAAVALRGAAGEVLPELLR